MATHSMEASDNRADLLSRRPASLFPAGLKVARGSFRERAVMFLLLALDCAWWPGIYITISALFGDFNKYGWPEVVLPTAITIFSLSLIGAYNPRSEMKSVGYSSEHLIACLTAFLISAFAVYLVASFGGLVASSRSIFGSTFLAFSAISLIQRRLIYSSRLLRRNRRLLVISDTESGERFYKNYTINGQKQNLHFFAAGDAVSSQNLLGAVRVEIGTRCNLIDEGSWKFVWIVDAPMFEPVDRQNLAAGWTAVHHPFTGPKPEFVGSFDKQPADALAYAYDIVLNGNEIGGGSIRIHQREVQQRVFKTIGLSKDEAESKFGFLLEAFNYGPPPHGGIALGIDRLCALLAGAQSIREVIAFPKTASGADPLTGAPTPITPAQRKESGVDTPAPAKE